MDDAARKNSSPQNSSSPKAAVDERELANFEKLGDQWWDLNGPQKALHKFNPVRVHYIRDLCCNHFPLNDGPRLRQAAQPLEGLKIIDIGCGGGILSESLARFGAQMIGIDPGEGNVDVARRHAAKGGLVIDYRAETVEALAERGEQFDCVLAMEVIEHVPKPKEFLHACAQLVRPGGLFFGATLNRTLKCYALAIVGAEYVLRWIEPGTHEWNKFLKPDEFFAPLKQNGLLEIDRAGVVYHPLRDSWRLSDDLDVNYMIAAERP